MIRPVETAPKPLLVDDRGGAAMLSISRATYWRLVSVGDLPKPLKIGRASRWRVSDLEEFAENLTSD